MVQEKFKIDLKVSFLITVFNDWEKLEETIPTLLNQNFDSFEIVIVDDGSGDQTSNYLKSLESRYERIKCFFPGKLGRGRALNYGIEQANGEVAVAAQDKMFALRNRYTELQNIKKNMSRQTSQPAPLDPRLKQH
ncbi:MAG: glycosyltransferase family 2 protein, partial [Chitinophagia bacterium]|nr:glycosyltransferase family 2 protein [Chitinophagia bacterium]